MLAALDWVGDYTVISSRPSAELDRKLTSTRTMRAYADRPSGGDCGPIASQASSMHRYAQLNR